MSRTQSHDRIASVVVSILVVISSFSAGVGLVQAASIHSVDTVDLVDNDGDGYHSNFNLEVEANTKGVGGILDEGKPYFKVKVNGEVVKTTDVVPEKDGTFSISIDPASIDASKESIDIVVELWDKDAVFDDRIATWDPQANDLKYEPADKDRTQTLKVIVTDEDGNRVSDANVIQFSNELENKRTNANGVAVWTDVPQGSYSFGVHVTEEGKSEHWGGGNVDISDGDRVTTTVERTAPRTTEITVTDEKNGDGDGTYEVGEPITISTKVNNDESVAKSVRVQFFVDGDQSSPYDDEETHGSLTIQSGESRWFGHDFVPQESGTYWIRLQTETEYGGLALTDDTGWVEKITVEPATISGQVMHEQLGEPVSGAAVYLDGEQVAVTDANGEYSIEVDSTGTHSIQISKDGFETSQRTVTVDSSETTADFELHGKPKEVVFTVSKKSSIEGYEFAGEPIANAKVTVGGQTKRTNSDGKVTFQLEPGSYTYTVSKNGYESLQDTLDIRNGHGLLAMSVPLVRTGVGVLDLSVVDENGEPIDAFRYRVLVDGSQVSPNAEGEVLLDEGRHSITIEPTDAGDALIHVSNEVTIESGKRTETTISPVPEIAATITSFDVDSGSVQQGAIIEGTVTVKNTGDTEHTFFIGFSAVDSEGNYYDNNNQTGTTVTLGPGETRAVEVAWDSSDAPTDTYDLVTAVWRESDRDALQHRLDVARKNDVISLTPPPSETDINIETIILEERGNGDGTFAIGERVLISPKVRSQAEQTYATRVKLYVDTDNDDTAERSVTRGGHSTSISPGDTQWYGYEFAPATNGTKDVRVVVQAYIGDRWVTTQDTGWTKQFTVAGNSLKLSAETGAFEFDIQNGQIILYNASWDRVAVKRFAGNRNVTFWELPDGTYHIEIYDGTGALRVTKEVSISGATHHQFQFTENTPYVDQAALGYKSSFDKKQRAPLDAADEHRYYYAPGESLSLTARVINPSGLERQVRVTWQIRNASGMIVDTVNTTRTLAADGEATLTHSYTPPETGTYSVDTVVRVTYGGDYDRTANHHSTNVFSVYADMQTVRDDNWATEALNTDELLNRGLDGTNVTIAVIVNGYDADHPAINTVYRSGTDWQDGTINVVAAHDMDGNAGFDTANPHGMGVLGAVWQFAPNASYVVVDVANSGGSIESGLQAAEQHDPDVIVMSKGDHRSNSELAGEFSQAADEDTLVVVSAGNKGSYDEDGLLRQIWEIIGRHDYEGRYPASPSTGTDVIAVSSTTRSGQICEGSSPANSTSNPDKPNIAAPGCFVTTFGYPPDYGTSGSSFAAPYTAGAVAQLLQYAKANGYTATEVRVAMYDTAIPATSHNGSRNIDLDGDGDADDDDLDGNGRFRPLGAYYELKADDQLPTTELTVTTVNTSDSTVSIRVNLTNTGADASNGGVYLAIPQETSFQSISLGGFDRQQVLEKQGVTVLELYTNNDSATSGKIVISVGENGRTDLMYRGWFVDESDAIFNPILQKYERYISRIPRENMSANGDPIAEGEVPRTELSNAPYNRHLGSNFSILEYSVKHRTLTAENSTDDETGSNQPPVAIVTSNESTVSVGSSVLFDAGGSTDEDGDALTYTWDLDGDGVFDDGTGEQVATEFDTTGSHSVAVKVSDGNASDVATLRIEVVESASIQVSRSLPDTAAPGEEITVTVTISVQGAVNGLTLDEEVAGLAIRSQTSTPTGTYKPTLERWNWQSVEDSQVTVTYTVRIPETANEGTTYSISGEAWSADVNNTTVTGDSDVTVRTCVAGAVSGDDKMISLQEIQRAIGDWAEDRPIAGETLTLQKIQRLIDAWAENEQVGCASG